MVETFINRGTITLIQLILPIVSVIMSVRHLGLVTGEAFASDRSKTCEPIKQEDL